MAQKFLILENLTFDMHVLQKKSHTSKVSSIYVSLLMIWSLKSGAYFNVSYSSISGKDALGLGMSFYTSMVLNRSIRFVPELSISENIIFEESEAISITATLSAVIRLTRNIALVTGLGGGYTELKSFYAVQCGLAISKF